MEDFLLVLQELLFIILILGIIFVLPLTPFILARRSYIKTDWSDMKLKKKRKRFILYGLIASAGLYAAVYFLIYLLSATLLSM